MSEAQAEFSSPITITSPLGDGVLLLHKMRAEEKLCQPYEYSLELYSEDGEIAPESLLGESMTVNLELANGGMRYFNGRVSRFEQVGYGGAGHAGIYTHYRAVLAPAIWFLRRTADCRIFQEMTAPDIIKEVFRKHDFLTFEESLFGSYRQRVYCVQYRETDADFVHRLMEEEGMYYYFKHEEGEHTLVLSDSPSSHSAITDYEEIQFYPESESVGSERECISKWRMQKELQTGKYAHKDFDFEKPKKDLLKDKSISPAHSLANLEVFDYPGRYVEPADGENYARVRIESMHASYEILEGSGNARGVSLGALVKLDKHPRGDQNREYLIVSAEHRLRTELPFDESYEVSHARLYECDLKAIYSETPFRPACVTQKPLVKGPQTAIVVGKAGEEIWTDEYGRVKVQFHWDRYGAFNEDSSCWIRVSQVHAGAGFGGIDTPRIGEEVIVDFLEGDPAQPIITGRVYNGDNKAPVDLPSAAMMSGLKSNSTPGGCGSNMFMMDDSKDKESMTVHAQKDASATIENDRTTTIVGGNDTLVVQAGERSSTVKGNTSLTVQAGDRIVDVTGSYKLDTTSEVNVQAPDKIVLTCGGSSITLEPGKITISAGDGASLTLDPDALLVSSGGSQALLDANVTVQSSGGSQMLLDANANMNSSGGSQVLLDGNATMSSPGEAKVDAPKAILSGGGATVTNDEGGVVASGAKISLN